jgi:hypothetical protein
MVSVVVGGCRWLRGGGFRRRRGNVTWPPTRATSCRPARSVPAACGPAKSGTPRCWAAVPPDRIPFGFRPGSTGKPPEPPVTGPIRAIAERSAWPRRTVALKKASRVWSGGEGRRWKPLAPSRAAATWSVRIMPGRTMPLPSEKSRTRKPKRNRLGPAPRPQRSGTTLISGGNHRQ